MYFFQITFTHLPDLPTSTPTEYRVSCPAALGSGAYPRACGCDSPSQSRYQMPVVLRLVVGFHAHLLFNIVISLKILYLLILFF